MKVTIYFADKDFEGAYEEYGEREVFFTSYGLHVKVWDGSQVKIIPWHRVHRVELHGTAQEVGNYKPPTY